MIRHLIMALTVGIMLGITDYGHAQGYQSAEAPALEVRAAVWGEVNRPGQYEYVNGMTALQGVTIAGGYTYRAKQDALILKRGGANAQGVLVPPMQPIMPGDIIEVQERFF